MFAYQFHLDFLPEASRTLYFLLTRFYVTICIIGYCNFKKILIIKELFCFVGTKIWQKSNTKQIIYPSRFAEIDILQRCMNRDFWKIKKSEKKFEKKCKVLKISEKNFSVIFVGLVVE